MLQGDAVLRAPGVVSLSEGLVRLISVRLADRGLSMRALARKAGVSHSTVSRLLKGQARPTSGLLYAIAPVLGLSADELLDAAGLAARGSADALAVLRGMGVDLAPQELLGQVRASLDRLRPYAATAEARASAEAGLERKVAMLGAHGPIINRLRALGRLYLSEEDLPEDVRLTAGSAVLYFLQAVDAIDDFIWPVGYLDDAVAVALADAEVRKVLGPDWRSSVPMR